MQPTHNLTPLMQVASCADELCDMNIFVEVLTALAIASSVLQVLLLAFCLLESGSRVKIGRFFFFSRKKNNHHKCRKKPYSFGNTQKTEDTGKQLIRRQSAVLKMNFNCINLDPF